MVEVGRITILDASLIGDGTIYDNGDILITYYDDATDVISVELNGTPVTSGELMLGKWQSLGIIAVLNAGVSFCQGNNLVSFGVNGIATREFPYFPKNLIINSPTCTNFVCTLAKYNDPIVTPATGFSNTDGSVKVGAANATLVTFGIGEFNFNDGVAGTVVTSVGGVNFYEATITGLLPGTYNIIGKDINGCEITYKVTIGFNQVSNVKYFSEFVDKFNNTHRLELLFNDFTGTATELLTHTDTPLTINYGGLKLGNIDLDKFITALSSKISYNLIVGQNYSFIDEFSLLSDGQVILKHYLKVGMTNVLQNQGYLILDNYTEPYKGAPYPISLFATDGLEYLDNFDYPNTTGIASYLNVIVTCLSFTKLDNDIISLMNLYEQDMNSGVNDDPLNQLFVNQEVFAGKKCSQVLGEILTLCPAKPGSVGATITSKYGNWYIYPVEATSNTVDYRKFDQFGAFIESGTINMFRFFEGATDTDRAVMIEGSNTLRLDRTFKNIIINEERILSESVFPQFIQSNILNPESGFASKGTGFEGFTNVLNGNTGQFYIDYVDNQPVLKHRISLQFDSNTTDDFLNNAYISTVKPITIIESDKISIDFDVFIDPSRIPLRGSNPNPYVIQQYSIRIGGYYYNGIEFVLSASEIIINEFIDEFNVNRNISVLIDQLPPLTGQGLQEIELRIYAINPIQSYNVNAYRNPLGASDATKRGITSFLSSQFDATGLPVGYRIELYSFLNSRRRLTYLTLQEESEQTPNSRTIFTALNSTFVWVLETNVDINGNTGRSALSYTNGYISNVKINYLPGGEVIPINNTQQVQNSITAPRDFTINLPFSDLTNEYVNEDVLRKNYLMFSDGSPTQLWDYGDGNFTFLQNILRDTYARQYKFSNRIINFTSYNNIDINPYNTMIIQADNGRALRFYELEHDVRRNKSTGTIIEIGSDTPITVGEYSNDYSDDFFN